MDSFVITETVFIVITLILCFVLFLSMLFNVYQVKQKKKFKSLFEENRQIIHAVMDPGDANYWECDFSKYDKLWAEVERHNLLESKDDEFEDVEELDSVDDDTPLGFFGGAADLIEVDDNGISDNDEFKSKGALLPLGYVYYSAIKKEYRDEFNQLLKDFIAGKTNNFIEIDVPMEMKDNRNNVQVETWKHIAYRSIKAKGGKVKKAICMITDVTSKKRIQREYDSIIKYQSFVQQSYPAFSRINLTTNKVLERFISIQGLSKEFVGYTAVKELEFIKKLIQSNGQNRTFVLDREELIIDFQNGGRNKKCSFSYKFENGELHWFNLYVELVSNPANGDIEAYCYLMDITSQTISLLTKDGVLRDEVDYIFWYNNISHECEFINKAHNIKWIKETELINYDKFISMFFLKKVPESDRQKVAEDFDIGQIEKKLENSSEVSFTYHTRAEDGSVEIKQEKVFRYEKESNILIFVCKDITEATLMENQQSEKLALAIKQAELANASKSDFLSRMSHDLRTPMNGIMGIAELAKKELDNPEALERDINKILSSSSYMLGLLNDILDMSKIESGRMEIRKLPIAFGSMLESIITLSRVMCEEKGVIFYCNKKPKDYENFILVIDKLHSQQIAMNLISNAVKYTPRGGRVELLLDSKPISDTLIEVTVIISDTGAGMTEGFQKIMYEAFTQDSNSVNKGGTGLGLAIVHNLVKLMNGTIECKSAPGEGTTFTIKVNVEKYVDTKSKISFDVPKDSGEKNLEQTLEGKRVLLVEDNELNQEVASRLLKIEKMEVEIANHGLEALNMFSERELNYYDVILMDVMMPVMDGFQATHLLRAMDRKDAKEVPIIAMTANAFTEDVEKCIEVGMNTHLSKPIEKEKMIATIKHYIFEKK